jgi:hypothetical protein
VAPEASREKAHAREADADLNKVALRARLAVIGAGTLDAQSLRRVYDKLLARALGNGHVANGATKIVLDLARASVEDAGLEKEQVLQEIEALRGDYRAEQEAKRRISREVARVLVEDDLPRLPSITAAVERSLQDVDVG